MVLLTYQLPDAIREIAMQGEFNEFDLNVFFSAEGIGDKAKFKYEDEVQKWLDLIRGAFMPTSVDNLKLGAQKPPMPFSDARLLNVLSHTFWFLPSVAACHAMRNLLAKKQNRFYHDYKVIVAAGSAAGIGVAALPPVLEAMDDPLTTKTITLSCGKLTTGVTVQAVDGHSHAAQFVQPGNLLSGGVPRAIAVDGQEPGRRIARTQEQIIKEECYVFDFAPDRALRQIADYSCRLNVDESNPEKKVEEFISFLPVLAYDGSSMKQIDAAGILDMAMSGTTATLLARRWESALLVNVDNDTLAPPDGQQEGDGCPHEHRGFPQSESGHRDHHQQVGSREEGPQGGQRRGTVREGEEGTDRGGEGIQEPAASRFRRSSSSSPRGFRSSCI